MTRDLLRQQIKRDEGTGPAKLGRFLPYTDTVGKLTIGFGRNLSDNGISLAEADALLDHDIDSAIKDLVIRYPWFEALDPVRQAVLVNMAFNLGIVRLGGFKNTLAAIQRGDYAAGAIGMLESRWASQVGRRALRLYVRRCGLRWLGVVLIVLALVCGVYALAFAQDDGFEFANGQPTSSIGRTVPEPIGTCGDVR